MVDKIILSDIDGTLVKGSLILNHALFLHEKEIITFSDNLFEWLEDQKNEELIGLLAAEYISKVTGYNAESLLVGYFMDEFYKNSSNFYKTLNLFKDFARNDYKIFLISGSANYLVDALVHALNSGKRGNKRSFFGYSTIYKKVNGRLSGEVIANWAAHQKYNAVSDILKKTDSDTVVMAFGDTISDLPLFEVAETAVLVNPTDDNFKKVKYEIEDIEVYYETFK